MLLTLESILARCDEFGECLRWAGPVANGSSQVYSEGRYLQARRVVHELTKGCEIRKGYHPVMRCRDPQCLQFDHMTLLTTRQVAQLAAKEGRFSNPARRAAIAAGKRNSPTAKLSVEIAHEIFHSTESGPVLAARHNVHRSLVCRIKRGQSWARGVANSSVFNLAQAA